MDNANQNQPYMEGGEEEEYKMDAWVPLKKQLKMMANLKVIGASEQEGEEETMMNQEGNEFLAMRMDQPE